MKISTFAFLSVIRSHDATSGGRVSMAEAKQTPMNQKLARY